MVSGRERSALDIKDEEGAEVEDKAGVWKWNRWKMIKSDSYSKISEKAELFLHVGFFLRILL